MPFQNDKNKTGKFNIPISIKKLNLLFKKFSNDNRIVLLVNSIRHSRKKIILTLSIVKRREEILTNWAIFWSLNPKFYKTQM